MAPPLITLLTDFGTADHYVGAMKGVMACICPEARFVDITHDIEPYAIADAAFTLGQSWQYYPKGTIHLVVVDPGVGSTRRPILAEVGGHNFVAPDNGVLTMVLASDPIAIVRQITNQRYFRNPVSQTFHGRDIFAPVAAHLASGVPAVEFGDRIDDPVRLPFHDLQNPDGSCDGAVLRIDRFGNIITSLRADLAETKESGCLEIGSRFVTRLAASYSEVEPGSLFLIRGSSGFLEISINQGNAAREIGAGTGDPVRFRRAGDMPANL
jgi:S-adenosylmethionine hydrolase